MCYVFPKTPKPKLLPEKRELPSEPPKPLAIGTSKRDERRGSNPFRIDLGSTSSMRGKSGAQV